MKACMASCEEIVKKLLFEHHCDIEIRNIQGKSIFDLLSTYFGKDKMNLYIEELQSVYPKINIQNLIQPQNNAVPELQKWLRNLKFNKTDGPSLNDMVKKMLELRKAPVKLSKSEGNTPDGSPDNGVNVRRVGEINKEYCSDDSDEGLQSTKNTTTYTELENSIRCHHLQGLKVSKNMASSSNVSIVTTSTNDSLRESRDGVTSDRRVSPEKAKEAAMVKSV